ncbi:hypothetical protein MFIFM68171_03717 [Madurella fahalii]|uniref:Uncharacterized protein n=1 Tax=Madurella fahalii TaxID=1157608 RepID=A0ABQ0G6X0_9PEZI
MGRPPIPMQMYGGRAQPGNLIRRPGTPGTFSSPSTSPNSPFPPAHTLIYPGFEFNFNVGISAAPRFPNPSLTVSRQYRGPEHCDSSVAPTERWLPGMPITRPGGLYGQAYVVGHGHFYFDKTERFDDWLSSLANLSLDRHDFDPGDDCVSAVAQDGSVGEDDCGANKGHGHAQVRETRSGEKRKSPSDDNDTVTDMNEPPPKRSRISRTFHHTVSRMGRATRASSRLSHVDDRTLPAATVITGARHRILAFTSRSPACSVLSRAGFVSAPANPERTVKICLIGDSGSGKTAFVNYLLNGSYAQTKPSATPNVRTVTSITENGTVVKVELWDFPGSVVAQRNGPLVSNFFHAAIICFSVTDVANVKAIRETWAPKLHASLHDGKIFVLGLKRDLRPNFPVLDLAFLPARNPVTYGMGSQAATAIHAAVYSECSAKEGDNVQGAWDGFVNYLVACLERHEQECIRSRRAEKVKGAVTTALGKFGLARLADKLGRT